MNEYINIIWHLIELAACVVESIMITSFMVNMLGYKDPKYKFTKFMLCVVISVINSTVVSTIIPVDSFIGSMQMIICLIFSLIFLNGRIFYKILTSLLSVFFVLIINSIILTLVSCIFKTPIYILISSSGIVRLLILISTKSIYFIITKFIIKITRNKKLHFSRNESRYIMSVFILTIVARNILFEVISSVKYSTPFSLTAIAVLVSINVLNYLIIHKCHQININKAKINRIAQEIIRHEEQINQLSAGSLKTNRKSQETSEKNECNNFENPAFTNYKSLNTIINNAVKDCREKNISVNCSISPYIENFPENEIISIISNTLKESISASKSSSFQPAIDLEILNNKNYLSIIISHYLKTTDIYLTDDISEDEITVPFNPYHNKKISNIMDKYNGIILFNKNRNKIITNIWLDFSKASLIK